MTGTETNKPGGGVAFFRLICSSQIILEQHRLASWSHSFSIKAIYFKALVHILSRGYSNSVG